MVVMVLSNRMTLLLLLMIQMWMVVMVMIWRRRYGCTVRCSDSTRDGYTVRTGGTTGIYAGSTAPTTAGVVTIVVTVVVQMGRKGTVGGITDGVGRNQVLTVAVAA